MVRAMRERPPSHIADAHGAGTSPLVGRTQEQVFLREELTAAIEGRGRLVLLGGEAGIGKTALARNLVREASQLGAYVLAGNCYDLTNTPPYGPWLDLVANYRPSGALPTAPAAFSGGLLAGIESQTLLFADVRRFLAALAAVQPTVVIFEDLHWADPASLELLRHVARQTGSLSLFFLMTYRVDELTRRHPFYQQLPALVREADGLRLDLRRLDADALRALIVGRFPLSEPDSERLVAYLERHSDGNPFFATELLRALREESLLQPSARGWALAELDRIVMPALLRQVIDGRVARLGEQTCKTLAIAAVIGHEVSLDLWAAVAGLDAEDLLNIVEQAADAHLLEAERDGRRVRFVHALTREALYDGVLPPRRRLWHLQVAEALAAGANADPDAVAFHFQEAGDPQAVDWLIRAGERAQRSYAWLTAVDRLQAAADRLAGVAGQERLRGWLLHRVARLERYSRPLDGIGALEEAERLAQLVGDEFLRADARHSRGLLLCYADDFTRGVTLMKEGVAIHEARIGGREDAPGPADLWLADALPSNQPGDDASDGGQAALKAMGMHYRRGSIPWFAAVAGQLSEAAALGEHFVASVEAIGLAEGLVRSNAGHAFNGLATAYAGLGRPDDARKAFAQARDAYGGLEHHGVIAFSLLTELRDVVIPYLTDRPAERRQLAAEAEAALQRASGAFLSGVAPPLGRLSSLTVDGEWDAALRIIEEIPPPGNGFLRREMTGALAYIASCQGDAGLARAQVAALLPNGPATAPGSRIHQEALFLQRIAADLCLDDNDLEGARAWLDAHDRWLAWSGSVLGQADVRLLRARWHRAAGDLTRAKLCAQAAHALAASPRQPLALIASHRFLGALAADGGGGEAAERHLTAALALAGVCAAPFERALTLLALAESHVGADRLAESAALLAEASAIFAALGATPALTRADALAVRLARHPAQPSSVGLTPREIEVLHLVAQGLTDASVAAQLYISPRTVSQHLRSIYAKLGVSSRAGATRFAVEHALG